MHIITANRHIVSPQPQPVVLSSFLLQCKRDDISSKPQCYVHPDKNLNTPDNSTDFVIQTHKPTYTRVMLYIMFTWITSLEHSYTPNIFRSIIIMLLRTTLKHAQYVVCFKMF